MEPSRSSGPEFVIRFRYPAPARWLRTGRSWRSGWILKTASSDSNTGMSPAASARRIVEKLPGIPFANREDFIEVSLGEIQPLSRG